MEADQLLGTEEPAGTLAALSPPHTEGGKIRTRTQVFPLMVMLLPDVFLDAIHHGLAPTVY